MAYAKPKTGSTLVPTSKPTAKILWKADKGKLYINTDGTKTVYYPDGSFMHYPGR